MAAVLLGQAAAQLTATAADLAVKVPPTGVRQCLGFQPDGWPAPQACTDAGPLTLVPKQDGLQGAGPMAYEAVPGQPLTACVRDRVSGLVWEGKPDSGRQPWPVLRDGPEGSPRFDTEGYGPQNKPVPGSRGHSDAYSFHGDGRPGGAQAYVAEVNASRLCGYADWRLPTVAELHGLLDLGKARTADVRPARPLAEQALINARWFPNTVPAVYLTSEWRDDASVWCVNFENAHVYDCDPDMAHKPPPLFVRLVRGPAVPTTDRWRALPDERGVADGAVEDRHTGLVWRRCAEPQGWNGRRCTGSARRYDYVQALQRASAQAGWRLPTIKEVNSLAQREAERFAFPATGFPAPGDDARRVGHWSSTVCDARAATESARASVSAWVLSDSGTLHCEARIMHLGVRLVRE